MCPNTAHFTAGQMPAPSLSRIYGVQQLRLLPPTSHSPWFFLLCLQTGKTTKNCKNPPCIYQHRVSTAADVTFGCPIAWLEVYSVLDREYHHTNEISIRHQSLRHSYLQVTYTASQKCKTSSRTGYPAFNLLLKYS